jgi:hypothetical protein
MRVGHAAKIKTEFARKFFDALENLFQHGLLDTRYFFGVDVIVRCSVFLNYYFHLAHQPLLQQIAQSPARLYAPVFSCLFSRSSLTFEITSALENGLII